MAATPLIEELSGSPSGAMIAELAGLQGDPLDMAQFEVAASQRGERRLAIYPASAGFDLVEELDYLSARAVEPNVFFNPRFMAPAMPRLEDRLVRLAVIRDGDEYRSRLRFLAPFSIERPTIPLGVSIIRTWSSVWGPLGTPLVDRDDPQGVIDDFLRIMARPHLKLPSVVAIPDLRMDGVVAGILQSIADARDLPLVTTGTVDRPFLDSRQEGDDYLRKSLSAHHFRDYRRLYRRLAEQGELIYDVARAPQDIRRDAEAFLALEAAGWKGRERTALVIDRFRAAFAREAIHRLAEQDFCRIHSLKLNGKTIASLIVFIESGTAYTWKTTYDEAYSEFSPGTLLMMETTRQHLDDPNIVITDSCAVPDHPVMSRLWTERRPIGTMLIGLTPAAGRATRQAASQLHLYRETRNIARRVRDRVRSLVGRR